AAPLTSSPSARPTSWCRTPSSWACWSARRSFTTAPSSSSSTPSSWTARCRPPWGRWSRCGTASTAGRTSGCTARRAGRRTRRTRTRVAAPTRRRCCSC
ncbi:hypothetical protein TSOC_006970, partial [Tetrabaena socialis]